MSGSNLCVCGHLRSEHAAHGIEAALFGAGCSKFTLGGTEARDKSEDWITLALFALLVERGEAKLLYPHDLKLHEPTYSTNIGIKSSKPFVPRPDLEPHELAEAMSTAWAERAIAHGADHRRQPTTCESTKKCVTCAAAPGEWCRAVHAGERDDGGWMHPGRGERDEAKIKRGRVAMRAQDTGVFNPDAAAARDIIRGYMLAAGAIELDFDVFGREDFLDAINPLYPSQAAGADPAALDALSGLDGETIRINVPPTAAWVPRDRVIVCWGFGYTTLRACVNVLPDADERIGTVVAVQRNSGSGTAWSMTVDVRFDP